MPVPTNINAAIANQANHQPLRLDCASHPSSCPSIALVYIQPCIRTLKVLCGHILGVFKVKDCPIIYFPSILTSLQGYYIDITPKMTNKCPESLIIIAESDLVHSQCVALNAILLNVAPARLECLFAVVTLWLKRRGGLRIPRCPPKRIHQLFSTFFSTTLNRLL